MHRMPGRERRGGDLARLIDEATRHANRHFDHFKAAVDNASGRQSY
jgi:hypothetical protein